MREYSQWKMLSNRLIWLLDYPKMNPGKVSGGVLKQMSLFEVVALIEALRAKLVAIAQLKSLTDPEVVNLSQRLDSWLNYYHKMVAFREAENV